MMNIEEMFYKLTDKTHLSISSTLLSEFYDFVDCKYATSEFRQIPSYAENTSWNHIYIAIYFILSFLIKTLGCHYLMSLFLELSGDKTNPNIIKLN